MLVDGMLRESDEHRIVRDVVNTLCRVASDWNKNLESDPDNEPVGVIILHHRPFGIENGIRECVNDLADNLGEEYTIALLNGIIKELQTGGVIAPAA